MNLAFLNWIIRRPGVRFTKQICKKIILSFCKTKLQYILEKKKYDLKENYNKVTYMVGL